MLSKPLLSMISHATDGTDSIDYGIHLRWMFDPRMGFPPTGFYLFRRKSDLSQRHCIDFKTIDVNRVNLPYSFNKKKTITRKTKSDIVFRSSVRDFLKIEDFKFNNQPAIRTAKVENDFSLELPTLASSIEMEVIGGNDKKCEITASHDEQVLFQETYAIRKGQRKSLSFYAYGANKITIASRDIKIIKICYWHCKEKSQTPWEGPINGDCGFGLPGYIVQEITDNTLTHNDDLISTSISSVEKWYKKYCDKIRAIIICRTKNPCHFSDREIKQFRTLLEDINQEGTTFPVGWNSVTQDNETPACPDDDSPDADIDMSAYDVLLMNSYDVDFAKILGLYFHDANVNKDQYYDYMLVAKWPEKHLWRLENRVGFDELPVGQSYYYAFSVNDMVFDTDAAEVISNPSNFAQTDNALIFKNSGFNFSDDNEIYFKVSSGCKEVQVFYQQDGTNIQLEALASKTQPALDTDISNKREGILTVHAENLELLRLSGKGIKIFRIHYSEDYLPYGMQKFIHCGIKVRKHQKLKAPDPARAKALSGGMTRKNEDCTEETLRFRAGLKWHLDGDLDKGFLSNAPICYHIQRKNPREEIQLITEGSPVFVTPETESYKNLFLDGYYSPDTVSPEYSNRFFYHDAVNEAGRYGYRVAAMDIFGRLSNYSREARVLLGPPPPPPPDQVEAKYLDYASYDTTTDEFSDPMLMADEKDYLRANGKSALKIRWQWTDALKQQAPEVNGFNLYLEQGWLNLLQGTLISIDNSGVNTVLEVKLKDTVGSNKLKDERLSCQGVSFTILSNTNGSSITITASKQDVDLDAGSGVTIALSKLTSDGGLALDYHEKTNWPVFIDNEAITSPSQTQYEVFIAEPPFPDPPFATADGDIEEEKTRYAQVGVSSITPDQESSVSTPASVMAIYREKPSAPTFEDSEGLMATRADYFGKSTFHLRWEKPSDTSEKTDVYRGMDKTLYLVDKANRDAGIRTGSFYTDYLTEFESDAGVALSPEEKDNFAVSDPDYESFGNNLLKALANLPDNLSAFSKLNSEPISQDDERYQNRNTDIPEPGATVTAPDSSMLLYSDNTLDGLGSNRYFYRLRSVDEIGNSSDFSMATFPVSTPEAYVETAPEISSITSGDRYVQIYWPSSPTSNIVAYNLYRTDIQKHATDRRRMELLTISSDHSNTVTVDAEDIPDSYSYYDNTAEPGVSYYYALLAITLDNDELPIYSSLSQYKSAQAVDLSPASPPQWISADWNGTTDAIELEWADESGLTYLLQRSESSADNWTTISEWLADGTSTYTDEDVSTENDYYYRIKVRKSSGQLNQSFIAKLVERP